MNVQININGKEEIIDVKSNDTLLTVLRRKNIISVKTNKNLLKKEKLTRR